MRRREFLGVLGGAAATWPLAARAQQTSKPLVAFVSPVARDLFGGSFLPFLQGLSESGYIEGRDLSIDYRSTESRNDVLPSVMTDLVRSQVSVIAAIGNSQAVAAKAATTTIPIVFLTGEDPVKIGFVASLNKPGGNLTGVNTLGLAVGAKRLDLIHESVPAATSIALLGNPSNPISTESQAKELQTLARSRGIQLHVLRANSDRDLDEVFASLVELRAGALVIIPDAFLNSRSKQLAALALRHKVLTIFQDRDFVAAGGLMSYGASRAEAFRLVGVYSARILKGEKPANLPIVQSTRVELFINLRTAKTLGVAIPLPLLGRADEVIE
jgi:putative ABC transport system substrate-binding protein